MNNIKNKLFLLITLAIISTGCSNIPLQPSRHSAPADELLTQADAMQQSGNLNGSIAQVERILRLEPRNAYAWHKLATLNLAVGDLNKAEQFALRSNQFAAGNREIINANQKVIDEVSRQRKNTAG